MRENPKLNAKQIGSRLREKGILVSDGSLASKVYSVKKKLRVTG